MEGARSAASVGKIGRSKQESRQRRLIPEEKEERKRVTFRLENEKDDERKLEEFKIEVGEELKEWDREVEMMGEIKICKELMEEKNDVGKEVGRIRERNEKNRKGNVK